MRYRTAEHHDRVINTALALIPVPGHPPVRRPFFVVFSAASCVSLPTFCTYVRAGPGWNTHEQDAVSGCEAPRGGVVRRPIPSVCDNTINNRREHETIATQNRPARAHTRFRRRRTTTFPVAAHREVVLPLRRHLIPARDIVNDCARHVADALRGHGKLPLHRFASNRRQCFGPRRGAVAAAELQEGRAERPMLRVELAQLAKQVAGCSVECCKYVCSG